ncbi:MAG TPA: ABC transporter transmembrane domain-containing protein, partial [Phytomonospora sp.]
MRTRRNTIPQQAGPARRPDRSSDARAALVRMRGLLATERTLIVWILLSGLVSVALASIGPWLLGRATDRVLSGALGDGIDFTGVGRILLYATLVHVGAGAFAVVQAWLANLAVQRIVQRLRDDVQAKISRIPLDYFDRQRRGEILSRVTNDIDNLGITLQQAVGQLVIPLFSIFGMLAVMFWISWLLALIALVSAPLSEWVV